MLRITVTENASEQRWILQGRLAGSSIEELTENWHSNRLCSSDKSCVVDVNGITSIDKDGEQVLSMMVRDGVKFVATGLYTKHLLESLSAQILTRQILIDRYGCATTSRQYQAQVTPATLIQRSLRLD